MSLVFPRTLLLPLLLVACGVPVPGEEVDREPPSFEVDRLSPASGASGVDPAAPLVLPFTRATCPGCPPCDIDASSLEGKVSFAPSPILAPTVSLEVTTCALVVRLPGGLPPSASCRIEVLAGVRDLWGNVSTEGLVLPFTTAPRDSTDVRPPSLVGAWPAPGDDRVGRRTPVTLYFDEEVVAPAVVSGAPALLQRAKPASWSLELAPSEGWPAGPVSLVVSGVADRAGNRTTRSATVQFTVTASNDVTPPVFAGLREATRVDNAVVVRWDAASDDTSPAAKIRYFVHLGPASSEPGPLPSFVSAPGQLEARLAAPSGPVSVLVRAQDEAGNLNAIQQGLVVP